MGKASQARWEYDLDNATEAYWRYFGWQCNVGIMSWVPIYEKGEALADKLPIVVGLGDQAADFLLGDSTRRLQRQLGVEVLDYIPSSKGMWYYEGAKQRRKISSLLAHVIMQAFNLPDPSMREQAPSADKALGSGTAAISANVAKDSGTTAVSADQAPGSATTAVPSCNGDAAEPKGEPQCCALQ